MKTTPRVILAVVLSAAGVPAQQFEIADVHVSPKTQGNQFMRVTPPRGGRYEIHGGTMLDLVRLSYGFDADKILGGPSWLEMDRFDVLAKVPADSSPEALKEMVKALLAERFQLATHTESKPLPTWAVTAGKKHQMKESDGTGDTGCRIQNGNGGTPGDGSIRLSTMGPNGAMSSTNLGPNSMVEYACHNMTMDSFASGLRGMLGNNLSGNVVLDRTGIEGKWNFDLKWSFAFNGPMAIGPTDRVTLAEAIEKQLGLKLEQIPVPTPVIVVDSVKQTPAANPPGATEAFPPVPVPTAFEVATIKPSEPEFQGSMSSTRGNTFTARGMTLATLLSFAFSPGGPGNFSRDSLIGLPKSADSTRYDITAKAPAEMASLDFNSMGPLLRSMLEERFGLKWHAEERPQPAYTLVAGKPKMKKADPASRTRCIRGNAPPGSPPGTQTLTCQNMTMAQFVGQIPNAGPGMNWPILDATGLEGGWDFALTFGRGPMATGMPPPPPPPGGGEGTARMVDTASALDPNGSLTLFEAVEKQLGLKLEMQKRPEPVVVIDHLDEKPTDN